MKPSNFTQYPFDSLTAKNEGERVARNIMVILSRAGDEFRRLSWDEYKAERLKDGRFTNGERKYFDQVVHYCGSAEAAARFSPTWARIKRGAPMLPGLEAE